MAKRRFIHAYKHKGAPPIIPTAMLSNRQLVWYEIDGFTPVSTPDGEMFIGLIKHNHDVADPTKALVAIVGTYKKVLNGIQSPDMPFVYMIGDKYYLPANDGTGTVYCRTQHTVLYEVNIEMCDVDLLGRILP